MGLLDQALGIVAAPLNIVAALDPTGLTGGVLGAAGLGGAQGPPGVVGAAGPAGGGGILDQVFGLAQQVTNLPGALVAGGQQQDLTGFSGGNGSRSTRTLVQTLDIASGRITTVIKAGSPFMMNKDVGIMRRVIKQTGALAQKIPRKMSKPSEMTQLKNQLVRNAFQGVTTGATRIECK